MPGGFCLDTTQDDMFDNNPNFSCKSEVIPVSYEIIQKRGYVELWIEGKFAGSFDSAEEARAEVNPA